MSNSEFIKKQKLNIEVINRISRSTGLDTNDVSFRILDETKLHDLIGNVARTENEAFKVELDREVDRISRSIQGERSEPTKELSPMNPHKVASELKRLAAHIDQSRVVSRSEVNEFLTRLVMRLSSPNVNVVTTNADKLKNLTVEISRLLKDIEDKKKKHDVLLKNSESLKDTQDKEKALSEVNLAAKDLKNLTLDLKNLLDKMGDSELSLANDANQYLKDLNYP